MFLVLAAMLSFGAITEPRAGSDPDRSSLKLWYRHPAQVSETPARGGGNDPGWLQALPIGNGRLGAMVFGGVSKERIQVNDNTLWDGHTQDTTNGEALKHLPEIRKLLFEGKNREATDLADRYLIGSPKGVKSYQTLGDLWIETDHKESEVQDYRRELDLDTGIVTVTYRVGDARFKRASATIRATRDGKLVLRLPNDQVPASISAGRTRITPERRDDGTLTFPTKAGTTYRLSF
jgi:hypothetical protein